MKLNWRNIWLIVAMLMFYTKYYSAASLCLGYVGLHSFLMRKK